MFAQRQCEVYIIYMGPSIISDRVKTVSVTYSDPDNRQSQCPDREQAGGKGHLFRSGGWGGPLQRSDLSEVRRQTTLTSQQVLRLS